MAACVMPKADLTMRYGRLQLIHGHTRSHGVACVQIRLFAKVLQLEPNHAGATVSTGNVWMDMLRYEKAVEYYRIAATLKSADPGDQPAAMHNLAQVRPAHQPQPVPLLPLIHIDVLWPGPEGSR